MCDCIAISKDELPDELIRRFSLQNCLHSRATNTPELWFAERDFRSLLPVWHDGQIQLYPWGSKSKQHRLPLGGYCRKQDLEAGNWAPLRPSLVEIIATFARSGGYWYDVPKAIKGVRVKNPRGGTVVYMLVTRSTHYYRTMTRSDFEPVFVGKQI